VVAGGTVFAGSLDDRLHALDAATGAERWTFSTGADVTGSPAVASGVVFIGSQDGHLDALDTRSGALIWSDDVGAGIGSSPALGTRSVYIATDNLVIAYRIGR
jgi:outer membrane protein assembly factor BamB